jgi:hypothetical protein
MQKDNEENPIQDREPTELPKSRRMTTRQLVAEIERLTILQEQTLIALGRSTYLPSLEEIRLIDEGKMIRPAPIKTDAEWLALGLLAIEKSIK